MLSKLSNFILCFVFCALFINVHGQGLTKKMADKYYNELSYVKACDYYSDLVKTKAPTEENLRRLAICYYNIQDYKNAETSFKRLADSYPTKLSEQDILFYFQSLKYNQNYTASTALLDKLNTKNNLNTILKHHLKRPAYSSELKTDSLNYKITPLKGVNSEFSEFSPSFKKNRKIMTFASNRKNNSLSNKTYAWDNSYFTDMWEVNKTDSITFTDVKVIEKSMATVFHDGPMVYSNDEKTIYLTRNSVVNKKVGKNLVKIVNLKLLIINYDSIAKKWLAPVEFEYNSNDYSVGHPALSNDGKYLYFASDMPGGYGLTDLYVSEFANGKWQKPINLGQAINTEGREVFPYMHEDGTLFFASDGRAGLGGLDLYFSPINLDAYFEPQNLGYPINTNMDDFGFYLNKDLLSGYVSSNRPGSIGKDDIFYFTSKNPIIGSTLNGIVFNNASKEKVPNVKVYLFDDTKKLLLDSTITDAEGKYNFQLKDPTLSYTIKAYERERFYDNITKLSNITAGDNVRDIGLNLKYLLVCTVLDADKKTPLEGVVITLTNKDTKDKKKYQTDGNGSFSDIIKNKNVGDKLKYTVKFEKQGYITTIQDYGIILDTNSIVNLDEQLNVNMQKMEIGNDIAKAIKINPIYFDLAKWDIKPVAALELDKIVAVMTENPSMIIELGSHTDCRSNKSYNLKLSDKRAKASANYIITKGIAATRIKGKGYGETKLINKCECEGKVIIPCTEDEHQANRRTEFIIVKF